MRTMAVSVYKFDELPSKIKEKVIEKNRDINVDIGDWYEYTMEQWKEKLAGQGFIDAEIHFSGFCSQGDGACFDAKCDVSLLASAVYSGKDEGFYREVLKLFADNGPLVLARIEKNSYGHHYSHANTRYITVDKEFSNLEEDVDKILLTDLVMVPTMLSEYDECHDDVKVILSGLIALRLKYQVPARGLDDLLNKFERDTNQLRKDLSNEIYRELEKDYDSLTSDESIIDTITANEYEFDEDGGMI